MCWQAVTDAYYKVIDTPGGTDSSRRQADNLGYTSCHNRSAQPRPPSDLYLPGTQTGSSPMDLLVCSV